MLREDTIWTALDMDNNETVSILPNMANRHGLIAGATGTGKTITLKVLAESFSDLGVPVLLSDVKGDLAGMIHPGAETEDMKKRIAAFRLDEADFRFRSYPTAFWDIEGKRGMPLRTTVSEFGPALLSRLLGLSELQTDILTILFRIADEEDLLLLDLKDLKSMIQHVAENNKEYSIEYGNMTSQSLHAILRAVVSLETEGGEQFFGEPAIDIHDFFRTDANGRGVINILDAQKTVINTKIYSTFMLYLMAELFEQMPEVGDAEKPKMVFFFDEAHLLFDHAPKVLLEKIEQVVKLIRSKGIGIFFITQNPSDVPDAVLAQLGNKIQHALRAYTPSETKKIKAAAASFRPNKMFNTEEALTKLGTGEALISFLDSTGSPEMVRRCRILPPQSAMGAIEDSARQSTLASSPLFSKYAAFIDRDSAYEVLKRKADAQFALAEQKAKEEAEVREKEREEKEKAKQEDKNKKNVMSGVKSVGRSTAGTVGREVGYAVGTSILGKGFGRRLGGNIGAALGRGLFGTLFKG